MARIRVDAQLICNLLFANTNLNPTVVDIGVEREPHNTIVVLEIVGKGIPDTYSFVKATFHQTQTRVEFEEVEV